MPAEFPSAGCFRQTNVQKAACTFQPMFRPMGTFMSQQLIEAKYLMFQGKLDFEATYKDEQLDGVVKKYGENGQVIQQGTFKNGVQVK